jgi:hypothetical protein
VSNMHLKRKATKAPLVVTEVRRSVRCKGKTHGYKGNSYPSKVYMCCDVDPPTLSSKVIRKLGQEFCKISPTVMSDTALKKKQNGNKVACLIGKKLGKAVKKNKPGKNEDTTKQQ